MTPAGVFPRQKRFRVSALLSSQSEVDGRVGYVHIADAQRLFRLGNAVHGYQLKLDDLFAAASVAVSGRRALDGRFRPRTWMSTHGNLHRAIGVQKTTMFVLLSFLVAVAAFNLVSTLVMVVDQRSSDVAILRSLGSDTTTVLMAFLMLGLMLGVLGIGLGVAVGLGACAVLPDIYAGITGTFGWDLMSQYFVNYLPVEVRLADIAGIVATAMVLCLLSTLYPAWRAVGLKMPGR